MASLDMLLGEISRFKLEVGTPWWVDVLCVLNPNNFYVRLPKYTKYLPLLHVRGDRPNASEINIGGVYLFQSATLKMTVRGKVLSFDKIGEDVSCKMFAIDDGRTEEGVPLNKIWKTQYLRPVPPLAIHCQLADYAPYVDTWDEISIKALKCFVEGKRVKMIIRAVTPDYVDVDLYDSNSEDVAIKLALAYHAYYTTSS